MLDLRRVAKPIKSHKLENHQNQSEISHFTPILIINIELKTKTTITRRRRKSAAAPIAAPFAWISPSLDCSR